MDPGSPPVRMGPSYPGPHSTLHHLHGAQVPAHVAVSSSFSPAGLWLPLLRPVHPPLPELLACQSLPFPAMALHCLLLALSSTAFLLAPHHCFRLSPRHLACSPASGFDGGPTRNECQTATLPQPCWPGNSGALTPFLPHLPTGTSPVCLDAPMKGRSPPPK